MPPGLSASASLEAAAAMGVHARRYHGEETAAGDDEDTDGATRHGASFPEAVIAACVSTEALQRRTGAGDDGVPTQHVASLVDAMLGAAGRLERCLGDAAALRASLQGLRGEEQLTEMALRDYDERPAENL